MKKFQEEFNIQHNEGIVNFQENAKKERNVQRFIIGRGSFASSFNRIIKFIADKYVHYLYSLNIMFEHDF